MKYLILLLLAYCNTFAQDALSDDKPKYKGQDIRSVVVVKGTNVVYRGVDNIINCAIFGIDAWDSRVSGPGHLMSTGRLGEFRWNVTSLPGTTAKLTVTYRLPDGSSKIEEKEFVIWNVKPFRSLINGYGGEKCIVEQTINELRNAKITVRSDDMIWEDVRNIEVKGFSIQLPDESIFEIEGDIITNDIYNKLQKLKRGEVFRIFQIEFRMPNSSINFEKTSMIKVMVSEK